MKKVIVFAMFCFSSVIGFGQEVYSSESLKENIEKQIEALNLSETQEVEFKAINEKYRVEFEEIQRSEGSRMSKFKALKKMRKAKNEEVEALLDEDQYKMYKDFQKENQNKMKSMYKERNR